MDFTYHYDSPLGGITLASDGENLTGLWFDRQKYFGSTLLEESDEEELPIFHNTLKWLDIYFRGKDPGFMPSLFTGPHSAGKSGIFS
jgi:methylated-DNA-[protein]-cysteine S-methyltransferase